MNKKDINKIVSAFTACSELNVIHADKAISQTVSGMRIFNKPLMGFGDADDSYFREFKKKSVIGKHHLLPGEWLPGARTVISFFLPFTPSVKKGNRKDMSWPSEEWLHGRIEGQVFLNGLCKHLVEQLTDTGFRSIAPSIDGRFRAYTGSSGSAADSGNNKQPTFTSNWSERHAAFVCGLGTFGLSRGLITAKGIAGRFGSVITEMRLVPDKRKYTGINEYCSMCGSCAKNCPVQTISVKKGKNHKPCSAFLDKTMEKFRPRYGCGKCQVAVPCESRIPGKKSEFL